MNKNIITLFTLFLISVIGNTQTISNAGFESWSNQLLYENPDNYSSSNPLSIGALGEPNALKTTDAWSGDFAVALETVSTSENPVKGAVYIGQVGEEMIWGGTPYTERADSVTGYVKYDVMPGDTAYVGVLFKKLGQPLGICLATFIGTQEAYQYFSQPVQWFIPIVTPDTIAVAILSSALFGDAIVGSKLTVDNISFVGATEPFPNGDFENWTEYNSEEADSWFSSNLFSKPLGLTPVIKTTDSYEGNYAVQMESMMTYFDDTLSGITNGHYSFDGPVGGMPVAQIPETLSGFYKYTSAENDEASANIRLFRYNTSLGESELLAEESLILAPSANYTSFDLSIQYSAYPPPDTVNIFFSVENPVVGKSGGVLLVDNLDITFKPVSVESAGIEMQGRVFPNPAINNLFVELGNINDENICISIYNTNGLEVLTKQTVSSSYSTINLNVSSLSSGLYFYRINSGNKLMQGKVVIE
jgi:hypothetical protein